jgi:predicted Zn-dependent peptidase
MTPASSLFRLRASLWVIMALLATIVADRPAGAGEMRRVTLPSGVRLILQPEPSTELVAISVCVRTEPDRGVLDDAAGELVARCLLSSSFNRSPERLSATIAQVGGSVETLRATDHVAITCVALPAQVREAIYLLCEVLKNADFGALEQVRAELLAEQRRGARGIAEGLDVLRRELQARPDLSELPFGRVSRAQVEAYFRTRYVPENTAIAVVGRFDVQTVQTALRDSLADFDRPGLHTARNEPLYAHATNYPTRTLSRPGAAGYALLATPAPPLSDADYPAFVVMKSILGEGHASRLFQRLRDARGIGYNVGAAWQPANADPLVTYLQWDARPTAHAGDAASAQHGDGASPQRPAPTGTKDAVPAQHGETPSPLAGRTGEGWPRASAPLQNGPQPRLAAGTAGNPRASAEPPLSPDAALRLLAEQVDGLVTDPPSDAEVRRGRSIAVGREALRHERARDRAFLLSWYEAMGVGAEFDAALPARIAAVTRADVLRVGRAYLSPRAAVLIVPQP